MVDMFNIDSYEHYPDWRWEEAVRFHSEGKKPSWRTSDKLVSRAYRFLKRVNSISSASDRAWVKKDYPDLFHAYQIFTNARSPRWLIEAAMLTDKPKEEIAKYLALKDSTIECYGKYFFDVEDKLESRGYILNLIFLPAASRSIGVGDHDLMLKILGYCGGWDILVGYLDRRLMSEETKRWFNNSIEEEVLRKAWVALQRVEVNNYNALEAVNLVFRLREIARAESKSGASQNMVIEHLRKLFEMETTTTTLASSRQEVLQNEPRVLTNNSDTYEPPLKDAEKA